MTQFDPGSRRINSPSTPAVSEPTTVRRVTDRGHVDPVPHVDTVSSAPTAPTVPAAPTSDSHPTQPTGPVHQGEHRSAAKTSAAAVFGLVFGLAALFCALTALLSPVAVVFGVLGLVLALVGLRMAKRPGVTGKGVAIGGLVTALLGLVLGGAILAGVTAVLNNGSQLDRIERAVETARAKLPTAGEVRDRVPGQ